jgi:MFS family permease
MMQKPVTDAPTFTQWRMAAILCLVNAIAFIDRTALPLLVQPIKRDLAISDTMMSFLIGAAFIMTYAIGGSYIGVLVDRFPRRSILSIAIAAWGTATIFCGSVTNYAALFLGRCGVGAGEAACGPASMSLIKDSFEPRFRGRAVAIWAMGASLGGGCALLAGGAILHLVGEAGTVVLPIIGVSVRAWQLVLIACGAISLPVALLIFTFPEPARRSVATEKAVSTREAFSMVRNRWAVFLPLFIANAATIMLSVSYSSWIPAFLGRTWKIPAGEIGLTFGLIVLFLSTASQFIAGFLVDITHRRFGLPAVPLLGVIVSAVILFPAIMIPLSSSIAMTWTLLAMFNLLAASLFTIGTSTVVHLSPGAVIGKITGVHFAWVGITGSAVAPTLIAVLAEQGFGGVPTALGEALSTAGGALTVIGGLSLLAVAWQLHRSRSPERIDPLVARSSAV